MDIQSQLRQFKDFLQLYNLITEHCFKHCVNTVLTRSLEDDEVGEYSFKISQNSLIFSILIEEFMHHELCR